MLSIVVLSVGLGAFSPKTALFEVGGGGEPSNCPASGNAYARPDMIFFPFHG
jgi:hypothetical protein